MPAIRHVSNPEPLTLYTLPRLEQIYDREEILRERAIGGLPRTRADRYFAKVLPAGSRFSVEPAEDGLCCIIECAYRPYYRKELYALEELVEDCDPEPTSAPPPLPPRDRILETLHAQVGVRYLFGGSAKLGSEAQARALLARGLFEAADLDDPDLARLIHSRGLDCSGLFNYCSAYHFFGDSKDVYSAFERGLLPLSSEDTDPARLAARLQPLDLIVQKGHVMIVIDGGRVIQSVGDGTNSTTFSRTTGWDGAPEEKYDRVVIDDLEPILEALLVLQARRPSPDWHLDDAHLMVVRSLLEE